MFYFLTLGILLFAIGLYGIFSRRDIIGIIISTILSFTAISINFVTFNNFIISEGHSGEIFALFITALTVAELTAIITLIIIVARKNPKENREEISIIKW